VSPPADDPLSLVRHVAGLARLALSEEELARHAQEFERLLRAFELLARFPGVEAAPSEAPPAGRERADEPRSSLSRADVLRGAPEVEGEFFAVPKTVGGER